MSERELGKGRLELTIATSSFKAPTRAEVFLPPGYGADPNRRWPVTYYLHGAQGDQKRFFSWFGDLIKDFPSIVVAPDGGPVGFYSDWYNNGNGGPPMYETYAVDDLVPLIDRRFRTGGRRAARALIGESMGGYGVLSYAARHPDVFAAAASMSALADNDYPPASAIISGGSTAMGGSPDAIYGPRVTQEARWRGHNPEDLAGNLRDVNLQVRTFEGAPNPIIQGGPDSAFACAVERAVYDTNLAFRAQLLALKVPHLWRDYGAGCHGLAEFRREFTDSLPGLRRVFADPRPAPRTFEYRTTEPRFRVWGWRIKADPARALEFLQMRGAGAGGLTLIGSGATEVTTPSFFTPSGAVDLAVPNRIRTVQADSAGRLRFSVDLGAPHPNQQYTAASRNAGDGTSGYFTRRSVRFASHPKIAITRLRVSRRSAVACLRSLGASTRVRLTLSARRDRRVARKRPFTVSPRGRCVRLRRRRVFAPGRYRLHARAADSFGHRLAAERLARRL